MRTTIIWIAYLFAGLGTIFAAAFMGYNNKDGWGWFLVVGFLIFASISISSDKKYTAEDLRKAFDAAKEGETWKDYYKSIQPKKEDDED